MKRNVSYKHIGKRLKFLADFTRNTDIDNVNMTLIICHYKEDIDEKLLNECHKFKVFKIVNAYEYSKFPEMLLFIYEGDSIEVVPNSTSILKIHVTLPIMSFMA